MQRFAFRVCRSFDEDERAIENEPGVEVDPDDEDYFVCSLPGKWEICTRCDGDGTIVNPSIDGHGLDPHNPCGEGPDPDFMEDYKGGVFDIACPECKGSGKVLEADPEQLPPLFREAYYKDCREEVDYARLCEAERRAGC